MFKYFSIAPLELPIIPTVKTVDSVISAFTSVLVDLQEVQDNAVEDMANAAITIKILQDGIVLNAKESERAKAIIDKIKGLLQ